jgi:hypothetical protein
MRAYVRQHQIVTGNDHPTKRDINKLVAVGNLRCVVDLVRMSSHISVTTDVLKKVK